MLPTAAVFLQHSITGSSVQRNEPCVGTLLIGQSSGGVVARGCTCSSRSSWEHGPCDWCNGHRPCDCGGDHDEIDHDEEEENE